MVTVNNQNYLTNRKSESASIFLVKAKGIYSTKYSVLYSGMIYVNKIYFPKTAIGKRCRIKIEYLED